VFSPSTIPGQEETYKPRYLMPFFRNIWMDTDHFGLYVPLLSSFDFLLCYQVFSLLRVLPSLFFSQSHPKSLNTEKPEATPPLPIVSPPLSHYPCVIKLTSTLALIPLFESILPPCNLSRYTFYQPQCPHLYHYQKSRTSVSLRSYSSRPTSFNRGRLRSIIWLRQ
jgi:hypothetical protein